ncbi:MAG TPA: hypothetical protein VK992_00300 [Candidatus Caenarcaniphilales bacterium]|nr:hypothetical protein [Candidatus Caenarcaniphilales bacterium]
MVELPTGTVTLLFTDIEGSRGSGAAATRQQDRGLPILGLELAAELLQAWLAEGRAMTVEDAVTYALQADGDGV